ncbi:hypothetical protein RND71_022680 [Anisodus tanguticus]|uniref:Fungal lipase-type domain-containing protein n=1 Tax=Anisodus tanguticus TaxID=243964 RepID=A0AAE1VE15_9SOLA|nr:hypothetical protein RND71_022680 [Anisodus tanguticus]
MHHAHGPEANHIVPVTYAKKHIFSNQPKCSSCYRNSQNNDQLPDSTRFFFHGQGNREGNATNRNSFKCEVISENDSLYRISNIQKKGNKFQDDEEMAVAKESEKILSENWKDIHGRNDWEGMLDPIDPMLQAELIRYGDKLQACYDAYDLDLSCKIDPNLFFELLAAQNMACLGRQDITIVWRKTTKDVEEIADLIDFQRPARDCNMPSHDPTIRMEAGFLNVYTRKDYQCNLCKFSAREQVLAEVKRLIDQYSDEEISITITGHSLRSGLAILNAYDIAEIGLEAQTGALSLFVSSLSQGQELGILDSSNRLKN